MVKCSGWMAVRVVDYSKKYNSVRTTSKSTDGASHLIKMYNESEVHVNKSMSVVHPITEVMIHQPREIRTRAFLLLESRATRGRSFPSTTFINSLASFLLAIKLLKPQEFDFLTHNIFPSFICPAKDRLSGTNFVVQRF